MARKRSWSGVNVLLTVGPTREALDPVRFLTNASSGRMGYALAREAARRGASVSIVHGPTPTTPPEGLRAFKVTSALDMRDETLRRAERADVVILCAAVSDWRFAKAAPVKLKSGRALTVRMLPNPDIAAELGALRRKGKLRARALVGFALETHDLMDHAKRKLEKKGLDLIVANQTETLAGSRIRFAVLSKKTQTQYGEMEKGDAAKAILDAVEPLL